MECFIFVAFFFVQNFDLESIVFILISGSNQSVDIDKVAGGWHNCNLNDPLTVSNSKCSTVWKHVDMIVKKLRINT